VLIKMLALIQSGEFQTHHDIAVALAVPPGLVLVMAEQLVQQGYLKLISTCTDEDLSSDTCDNCSSHAGCFFASSLQGWLLTERGRNLALSLAS
jgi:hypothetical protein